jgi:hypothetical protein
MSLTGQRPQPSTLLRRGLVLEYATLGWNIVEIGFLIVAAVNARSVALAGFALDSVIEIFASVIVVWRLKGTASEEWEARAIRMIGVAFFGLAIYISAQSVVTVASGIRPDSSLLGIAWLSATTLIMFALAYGKLARAVTSATGSSRRRQRSLWSMGRSPPRSLSGFSSTLSSDGGGRTSWEECSSSAMDYERESSLSVSESPRRVDPLRAPVRDDMNLLDGHHPVAHHRIERREDAIDVLLGVHDLDHDREVLAEPEDARRVEMGARTVALDTPEDGRPSQSFPANAFDDRLEERGFPSPSILIARNRAYVLRY